MIDPCNIKLSQFPSVPNYYEPHTPEMTRRCMVIEGFHWCWSYQLGTYGDNQKAYIARWESFDEPVLWKAKELQINDKGTVYDLNLVKSVFESKKNCKALYRHLRSIVENYINGKLPPMAMDAIPFRSIQKPVSKPYTSRSHEIFRRGISRSFGRLAAEFVFKEAWNALGPAIGVPPKTRSWSVFPHQYINTDRRLDNDLPNLERDTGLRFFDRLERSMIEKPDKFQYGFNQWY